MERWIWNIKTLHPNVKLIETIPVQKAQEKVGAKIGEVEYNEHFMPQTET